MPDGDGAEISECGAYRYALWRTVGGGLDRDPEDYRVVGFVMLNPSTADATVDDPTIRRCTGYAKRWGFDALYVVNLFAYRATHPNELLELLSRRDGWSADQHNDEAIEQMLTSCELVVGAWGASGGNAAHFLGAKLLEKYPHMMALGLTQDGQPRHPLYMPKAIDRRDLVPLKLTRPRAVSTREGSL